MKLTRITHEEVNDKKFSYTGTGGYKTVEVDTYLDDIAQQLQYYENLYSKYTALVSNFETVKQKTSEYEMTIKKLKNELEELYSNGYSNKIIMQRLTKVEAQQNIVFDMHKIVSEINFKIDGTLNIVKSIADLLERILQQK